MLSLSVDYTHLFITIVSNQYYNMKSPKVHPQFDREFIQKSFSMILKFLQSTLKGQNKVIDFKLPRQLKQTIQFQIDKEPCEKEELIKLCSQVLENQVKPYHPHFHNQLFGGFDQHSYIGALIVPSINGSVFTYQIAPCFTLMEDTIYEHMRKILGWTTIDGTMTPGGSFANFMALVIARHRLLPEVKSAGLYGCKPLKIFTSEVAHYSIKKGVMLCGSGLDNIVYVKTDQNARMIPQQLQKAIKAQISKGCLPLMVYATLGTTVQGNFDPLTKIGQICAKYRIWLHADCALGGAFLFSEKLKTKLGSFKNVDSISVDAHKGLVVSIYATFFLCKHANLMNESNATHADYLFHQQRASYNGNLDVGDKTLQCTRTIDIVKLWTYFKGNGWKKIQKQVQNEHTLALYTKKYVTDRPTQFQLVIKEVESFNVCFWYVPEQMYRNDFTSDEEYFTLLGKITVLAKKFMIQEGKMLVGYSKSKIPYYFWRIVMSNPFNTTEQIDFQMQLIAKYCEQAYAELAQLNELYQ